MLYTYEPIKEEALVMENTTSWEKVAEFKSKGGIVVRVTKFTGRNHPRYSFEVGRTNAHNDRLCRHLHIRSRLSFDLETSGSNTKPTFGIEVDSLVSEVTALLSQAEAFIQEDLQNYAEQQT